LIRRAHQIDNALFADELAGYDVTPFQYAALTAIRAHPEIDATRLSKLLVFDKSTLGSVLERLHARGLISRVASAHDRRAKCLRVTPAGAALAACVDARAEAIEQRFLAPLPRTERTLLLRLLRDVVAGHAEDEAKLT
jgi:DNA-binding MarR family transcriptional regulator